MAARIMMTVVVLSSIACLAWAQNGVAVKEGNDKAPTLETLKWLAGRWEGDVEGDITEEHWTEPGGGMLLGMNRRDFLNVSGFGSEDVRYMQSRQLIFAVGEP